MSIDFDEEIPWYNKFMCISYMGNITAKKKYNMNYMESWERKISRIKLECLVVLVYQFATAWKECNSYV